MQYDEGEGKIRYYESPAWGEWCKRVYGGDLKQIGMVTMDELALFFREVNVAPDSHILDMGCGPGYLSSAVAGHYSSLVTGIDVDEPAIAHAKMVFSKNPLLDFRVVLRSILSKLYPENDPNWC
jgi:cyclopropane fatty-acyl-phospholipid synthase-like methyltransferase